MSVTHTISGGNVHLSGNRIQVILTGTNPQYKLAIKITCASLFGSPFEDEIKPDVNLNAEFDISGYFDQPVDYTFDYPGGGKVTAHSALAFVAYIDIGEVYIDSNGDRQVSWAGINETIRVLKGKLRPYELALLNDDRKSFASEYIDGGKFLTHLPNNQVVDLHQLIKLWYLSRWETNHDCVLKFRCETDDKVAHLPIEENVTLYSSGLFEFSMNPDHIGYYPAPGAKIIAYNFWLTETDANGGADISERRRFVIDLKYHEKTYYFYYVNPLSGIDCIRLTGEQKEGISTTVETAYKPAPVASGSKIPEIKTISAGSQRTWEINTGRKSRDEMLSLRDFLDSKQRWMIDPDNDQKVIPVYIEGADHLLSDSMEDLQKLSVKILEAFK